MFIMIIAGIIVLVSVSTALEREDSWVKLSSMDRKQVMNEIWIFSNSKIFCATKCTALPHCKSFFFDKQATRCFLHDQIYDELTPSSQSNTIYYVQSTTELSSTLIPTSSTLLTVPSTTTIPTTTSGPCAVNYTLSSGICFFVHLPELNMRTWEEARSICQGDGGELMIIDSSWKHGIVTQNLPTGPNYNIGVYGFNRNGDFQLVDGRTNTNFNYTNWGPSELSKTWGSNLYVKLVYDTTVSDFVWIGDNGSQQRRYICEILSW